MDRDLKVKAYDLFESGDLDELYLLIKPLIANNDPDAIYLYSCFSLPEWEESDEQFEERSAKLLKFSAENGVPEALYKLACAYLIGDGVDLDAKKSAFLFKLAAEKGHSRSKLSYGLDLFYGDNGVPINKSLGLGFIKEAAD